MIRVVGAVACQESSAEADPWIPLRVIWGDGTAGPWLHLYVRDRTEGYVEFKVDPGSGALRGLVVIDLPRRSSRAFEASEVSPGLLPLIDLELWPWKVTPDYKEPAATDIDLSGRLTYTSSSERVTVWFSDTAIQKILEVGAVRVGVAGDGGLVAVDAPTVTSWSPASWS